jgi:hypothetical protein
MKTTFRQFHIFTYHGLPICQGFEYDIMALISEQLKAIGDAWLDRIQRIYNSL